MLSVNPHAASPDDVALLAAELMAANALLASVRPVVRAALAWDVIEGSDTDLCNALDGLPESAVQWAREE